jgi:hypothetical protein
MIKVTILVYYIVLNNLYSSNLVLASPFNYKGNKTSY